MRPLPAQDRKVARRMLLASNHRRQRPRDAPDVGAESHLDRAVISTGNALTRGEERLDGPVDCALILGAGVAEDGTPSWVLHDRLAAGLALHRTGRVLQPPSADSRGDDRHRAGGMLG